MMALSVIVVMLTALFWLDSAEAGDSSSGVYTSIKIGASYGKISEIETGGTLSGPVFSFNDIESEGRGSLHDVVGGLSAALGNDFGRYRVEIEYNWRYRFDLNGNVGADSGPGRTATFSSDVETQSLMLNLFWDFDAHHILAGYSLQPYLGAGVGVVVNKVDSWLLVFGTPSETNSNSEEDSIWMFTAGGTIDLSDRWLVDIAYRYMDLGEVHIGPFSGGAEISTSGQRSHDLTFGFRYRF